MKTLIWKEWREQRLFFFLAVGIIILYAVGTFIWPNAVPFEKGSLEFIALILLPVIFSLGIPATSFTSDFTKKTLDFQLSNPVSSAKIFWVKFLFNLVLLLILIAIMQVFLKISANDFARLLLGGKRPYYSIIIFFLSIMVIYSAGTFSAMLLKSPLTAIISTAFMIAFGVILLSVGFIGIYALCRIEYFFIIMFSFLFVLFLSFSFFLWQKALVKQGSMRKIIGIVSIVAICFAFIVHGISSLAVSVQLKQTLLEAKRDGIKLTPEKVIPPPVPDKDNAALVYQQAFDLADRLKEKYKTEWEYVPYESKIKIEELTVTQKRNISRIMQDPEFVKLFALTEKAVNMPACRFDIQYKEGPAMLLPHLSKIRNLAKLVAARTYILSWEGKGKKAWDFAETGLYLGNSVAGEPILISQLVHIAIDNIALESFKQLLHNSANAVSNKHYRELISKVEGKNRQIAEKALEAEASLGGFYFFRLGLGEEHIFIPDMYYFPKRKNIDNFADFMIYTSNSYPSSPQFSPFFWKFYGSYLGRPILKKDYIFYIKSFSKLMELSKKPYPSVKNEIAKWERSFTSEKIKHPISSLLMPALGRVLVQQAIYNANLDTFKLALALKIYQQKHANYPDSLTALVPKIISEIPVDPFTGKDYIYRREGKGFMVYSFGPNEKDDNGIYDSKKRQDDISFKVTN